MKMVLLYHSVFQKATILWIFGHIADFFVTYADFLFLSDAPFCESEKAAFSVVVFVDKSGFIVDNYFIDKQTETEIKMGKFDGYLICTDLDGTFTNGHDICGENAKYVKYFQDNGGLFTVSTGRLPGHFSDFEGFRPNCPVITHNGAVIYDFEKDEILYKRALPNNCTELCDFAFGNEKISRLHMCEMYEVSVCKTLSDVRRDAEYFKAVFCIDDEQETIIFRDKLKERFGDRYCIFLGWSTGIEALAKDINKGTAVKKLREILGDKVKKMICVGDSESDSFMMREADIGYAVENADKAAKAAADRVTVHYEKGAIAQIIRDIENELP